MSTVHGTPSHNHSQPPVTPSHQGLLPALSPSGIEQTPAPLHTLPPQFHQQQPHSQAYGHGHGHLQPHAPHGHPGYSHNPNQPHAPRLGQMGPPQSTTPVGAGGANGMGRHTPVPPGSAGPSNPNSNQNQAMPMPQQPDFMNNGAPGQGNVFGQVMGNVPGHGPQPGPASGAPSAKVYASVYSGVCPFLLVLKKLLYRDWERPMAGANSQIPVFEAMIRGISVMRRTSDSYVFSSQSSLDSLCGCSGKRVR